MFDIKNLTKSNTVNRNLTAKFLEDVRSSNSLTMWLINREGKKDIVLKIGAKHVRSLRDGVTYRFRGHDCGRSIMNESNGNMYIVRGFKKVIAETYFVDEKTGEQITF